MDEGHNGGGEAPADADGGGEPLQEGAQVRAQEGVEGVDDAVVRGEAAARQVEQPDAGREGVGGVRTGPRHRRRQPILPPILSPSSSKGGTLTLLGKRITRWEAH